MSLIERAMQRMDEPSRLGRGPASPELPQSARRRADGVPHTLHTRLLSLVPSELRSPPTLAQYSTGGPSRLQCSVVALACLGLGAAATAAYVGVFGRAGAASEQATAAPRAPAALALTAPFDGSARPPAAPAVPAVATVAAARPDEPRQQAASAVAQWATAWSARDAARYLGFYAAQFVPPGKLARGAWEDQRRARLLGAARISVLVEDLNVELLAPDRAVARFAQTYEADRYRELRTPKVLVLVREGDAWRIASETAQR